jgi:hypothetical protein
LELLGEAKAAEAPANKTKVSVDNWIAGSCVEHSRIDLHMTTQRDVHERVLG